MPGFRRFHKKVAGKKHWSKRRSSPLSNFIKNRGGTNEKALFFKPPTAACSIPPSRTVVNVMWTSIQYATTSVAGSTTGNIVFRGQ